MLSNNGNPFVFLLKSKTRQKNLQLQGPVPSRYPRGRLSVHFGFDCGESCSFGLKEYDDDREAKQIIPTIWKDGAFHPTEVDRELPEE